MRLCYTQYMSDPRNTVPQNDDGTPAVRHFRLLQELDKRFPLSPKKLLDSSIVIELEYLKAIDAVIADSQEFDAVKRHLFTMFMDGKLFPGERT